MPADFSFDITNQNIRQEIINAMKRGIELMMNNKGIRRSFLN